jgi:hypothetical protein
MEKKFEERNRNEGTKAWIMRSPHRQDRADQDCYILCQVNIFEDVPKPFFFNSSTFSRTSARKGAAMVPASTLVPAVAVTVSVMIDSDGNE